MRFKPGDKITNPNWNQGLPLTVVRIVRPERGRVWGYRLQYPTGRDYWFDGERVDKVAELYLSRVSREFVELFI